MLCGKLVQNISLSLVYSLPPLRRARANILSKCVYIYTIYHKLIYTVYYTILGESIFCKGSRRRWVGGWLVGWVRNTANDIVCYFRNLCDAANCGAAPSLLYSDNLFICS